MPTIMHICSDGTAGGATTVLLRLITNVDKKKFKHIVVIPSSNYYYDKFSSLDIELISLRSSQDKSFSFSAMIECIGYIKRYKPNIIHTHGALFGRLSGKLCGVHSLLYTRHTFCERSVPYVLRLINNSITDKVVSVSEILTKQITDSGINEDSIIYIENGCNDFFSVQKDKRDPYRLLFLGRLTVEKGIYVALKAIKMLHSECSKYSLCICGSGPVKEDVLHYIQTNKMSSYVTCLPFQTDISPVLESCGIMLNCSYENEATSNSIIEALSSGMPVCASDIPGNLLVLTDGTDGILFESGKTLSLVRAVRLIQENYADFSVRARETYIKRFTSDVMVNKYEKLWMDEYDRVIKRKK